MELKEFYIEEGMSCSSCANRLEKGLLKDPYIKNASVHFSLASAIIDSELSAKALIKYMDSLGFTVSLKQGLKDIVLKEKKDEKKRILNFLFCSLLTIPVITISMFHIHFYLVEYLQFFLTTLIMIFPARQFYINAYKTARHFSANMDTLVATSTLAAWAYSTYCLFAFPNSLEHLFYETAAMLLLLIMIGKFFEQKAKFKTSESLRALAMLRPERANRVVHTAKNSNLKDIRIESIQVAFLKKEDVVLVKAGEKIPADGIVISGESSIDNSFLTGESKPVNVAIQSEVIGGSINLSSPIEVKVSRIGAESELDKIMELVLKSQTTKTHIQKIADKISFYFVPFILLLAALTFVVWYLISSNIEQSVMIAVSVLVVACPCALGLATPTAILVASGKAAQNGVIIKDTASLEMINKIDTIIFDKTGSLTEGKNRVTHFVLKSFDDLSEVTQVIYHTEISSNHPIAKSLLEWSKSQFTSFNEKIYAERISLKEIAGEGMIAEYYDKNIIQKYFIGKADLKYINEQELIIIQKEINRFNNTVSPVIICKNNKLLGVFYISDKIRDDAKECIQYLSHSNINSIMSTGDEKNIATYVAQELNIKEFYFNQSPSDKYELIDKLHKENHIIAMVGDGVNDAPALAKADIGIAMGGGTQVASSTAQIILQKNSIAKVIYCIQLSKKTIQVIKQNLFWAFSYNIILVPMAVLGKLNPMIAAALMGFSSVIVVLNSLRIHRMKLTREEH